MYHSIFKFQFLSWYRSKGRNYKSVLVIGPLPSDGENSSWNDLDPHWGYKITAVISEDEFNSDNYLELLEKHLLTQNYDEILVTKPSMLGNSLESVIDFSEHLGLRVRIVADYMKSFSNRVQLDYINGAPVINVRHEPLQYWHNRALKRIFDVAVSLFFIVTIYWWLHLIIGLIIKLTSKGPVLFKQRRIGVDNKPFECYKFRSMTIENNTSSKDGFGKITAKGDARITRIGSILRMTNLDELPQFLNVLKGDMSIVGPRPHMVQEDYEIQDIVKKYRVRRFVKPGITGWAQINGFRGGTKNLELMQKRIEHDIFYIERWTYMLDMKIIWKTAWQMMTFNTQAH